MKNLIALSSLGLFLLAFSCKKNEQTDPLPEENNTEVTSHQTENIPLTRAHFDKEFHDFGDLKKGDIVQHTYEITNTGDKPLIISNVKPACGCTAPDYTQEPIAPGQKGKVILSFNSQNFSGLINKTAHIYINVENSPVVLSFKANVQ